MKWIDLSDRYPEAKHSIPNEDCRCPCCEDEFHEVSDFVYVRTFIQGTKPIRARWNKTTGMWEQIIGRDGKGREIIDPVVMPFIQWRPE